jgi:hypothetical protein
MKTASMLLVFGWLLSGGDAPEPMVELLEQWPADQMSAA